MIPTPTPFPSSGATPFMIQNVDPAQFSRNLAMDGVQWWNIINNANNIFTMMQITIIVILVFVGIKFIMKALNTDV